MEFIKNNKIVLGIAGTVILIGGIITFFILSGSQDTPKTQPTLTSTYVPPSFSSATTPQEIAQGWQEGATPQYSVLFPDNWTPDVSAIADGGTSATFMPNVITGTTSFPRFQVEVSPANTSASVEERLKTLYILNFDQSDILFHGIPAVMLEGNMPFEFFEDGAVKAGIKKTFIFFSYNENIYAIIYAYYADEHEAANKKLLDTMLASFQVK